MTHSSVVLPVSDHEPYVEVMSHGKSNRQFSHRGTKWR